MPGHGGSDDRSREAVPREDIDSFPDAVWAAVGGEAERQRLTEFARLLVAEGEMRGLIGPRELPRLWSRHLVNSLAINEFVPRGAAVADVGAGAGFPGMVLAISRPDVAVTLVEPMGRRCEWLVDVTGKLGLENVSVENARAEELHGARTYGVVTARAVAALDKLARWTMPLVSPGGSLLALKGERAGAEIEAARGVLSRLGAATVDLLVVLSPLDGSETRVVQAVKATERRTSKKR